MEEIISYFSTIPSSHRTIILFGGLALLFSIESIIPMFRFRFNRWKHAGINLVFTGTTIIINFVFAFIIVQLSDYLVKNKFGLLYLVEIPSWLFMILGVLGLDLVGAWLAHFLEHKVRWMWKFHQIHHTDPGVDATTANRHHPGESLIRVAFTMLGVAVMGAPMWLLMVYQTISVVMAQTTHMNLRIPKILDKILSFIIVSPDMHKVHHHYKLPYTNTNYGNIFSIWDRLFRTFAEVKNCKKELIYGLDTFPEKKEHSNLGYLFVMPFKKYRAPRTEEPVEIEQ